MRAQNKETLQSIIDNTELSEEEKSDAVAQMVELTKQSETEMEIETLMATKGFSEAVVSLGEDSADVVVNAEELTDANRAQIEDIVTRKSDVKPEKIVITPIESIFLEKLFIKDLLSERTCDTLFTGLLCNCLRDACGQLSIA